MKTWRRLSLVLPLVGFLGAGCGDATKPDATPPGAVTDLRVAGVGDSSVTLAWTAPGDDGTQGRATAYDLRYGRFSVLEYWKIASPAPAPLPGPAGSTDSVTVSGLREDTGYKFALRAVDDAGNWSDLSNMASVPPSAVTDLTATVLSHHVVELHWTAPGDDWDQGTVTGYDIRYATEPFAPASWDAYPRALFAQTPVEGGETENYQFTGLIPNTGYWMAVRGYDEGGNLGGMSNVVMATTPADTVAPVAVTDLAASGETEHSITLSWTAPGDDGTEGRAASYDVRYSTQPITDGTWDTATPAGVPFTPAGAGTHEELTVGSLATRVVYRFALKTTDAGGNVSGLSNVVERETGGTKTWRVLADGSGDAPTIQAAIEWTHDGDVVLVEPGTYYENINLRGKAIHLKGDAGPEVTILDGTYGDSSVVVCNSGENNSTIIEGLTITHGKGTVFAKDGSRLGGGVFCQGTSPVIRGNIIRNNRSENPNAQGWDASWGGGIVAGGIIENNVIVDNFAAFNAGGLLSGGVIRGNVVRGNTTPTGDGGGLYTRGPATIEDNLFLENVAGDHGGGIYVAARVPASEINIAGNVFIANRGLGLPGVPDCSGGAIWVDGGAYIHENTIAFNEAGGGQEFEGGGICLTYPSADMLVERNVLYRNTKGGLVTSAGSGSFSVMILRNLLYENEGQDIYNLSPGQVTLHLEENLFEDPLFCTLGTDTRGDLAGASPALNQPYGVIGAVAEPGCGPYTGTGSQSLSPWRRIESRAGSGSSLKPGRREKN